MLRRNAKGGILVTLRSTPANSRSKNVGIVPIVIPELKFRDVKRHILGADFVKAADDAALEDASEAFNRIGR
jgi:hypothetical protein